MADIHPPVIQRPRLLALASSLDISLGQLRRDACGDWSIIGRFGHIYSAPLGFLIPITDGPWTTARGWNICKKEMSFATLVQDGDDEGVFALDILPDIGEQEAEIIRKWVGLRKRKHISEVEMERLRFLNPKRGEQT